MKLGLRKKLLNAIKEDANKSIFYAKGKDLKRVQIFI